MAPDIRLYDTDDNPLTTFAFGDLPVGLSDPVTIRVYNGFSTAADTAAGAYLTVGERDTGEAAYVYDGSKPITGAQRLRVTLLGGLGGLTVAPEAAVPWGAGAPYLLPILADGEGIEIELRIFTPADGAARSAEFEISPAIGGFVATGPIGDAVGYGVYFGARDARESGLVEAAALAPTGTPDDEVHLDSGGWLYEGTPFFGYDLTLALDGNDADAVALASGESYWAAIYGSATGLAAVKGLLGADPIDPATRPALTAAQRRTLIGWVERPFSGVITGAEITDARLIGFGALSSAGLTLTIGPSRRFLPGAVVDHQVPEQITLADNDTSELWALGSGGLDATVDGRPDPVALLLATVTTLAGAVSVVDHPFQWLPRPQTIALSVVGLAVDAVGLGAVTVNRDLYVAPHSEAIAAKTWDAGSGMASGATEFAVEYLAPSSITWAEITSAGNRPSIAFDDADLRSAVGPSAVLIPRGSILRARNTAIPTGGTLPDGATITVEVL
jgi:hypothetical protein